ncbi:MAG: immunity 17 family protein [Phycisphaerales bacterium JB063]
MDQVFQMFFDVLFAALGVFAVVGAVANWDWYMNSKKAQNLSRLLTRNGARVFYILIGAGLAAFGTLVVLGKITF